MTDQELMQQLKEQAKKRRIKTILIIGGVFLAFIVLIMVFGTCADIMESTKDSDTEVKSQEEIRQDKIESGFNAWDGSHKALTTLIKANLKKPKSFVNYEHIETLYWDKGDHILIRTKYRAENLSGGYIIEGTVSAKADLDGEVLEVLSSYNNEI